MNDSQLAASLRLGGIDEVRQLLKEGEDPNACGDFHISKADFEEKLDALIAHGWEINRCQLLHDAKHGFAGRVGHYLRRGADPELLDHDGNSPLDLAVVAKRKTALKVLIKLSRDGR